MLSPGHVSVNILGRPASFPLVGVVSPRMQRGLNQRAGWWGSENKESGRLTKRESGGSCQSRVGRPGTFRDVLLALGLGSALPSADIWHGRGQDYSTGSPAPPHICKWNLLVERFHWETQPLGFVSSSALTSSVALNEFLNLSVPRCPHLYIGVIIGTTSKGCCEDEVRI